MHLRYTMYEAPQGHPQAVLASLGITYTHATPQSMGDQWWFWDCRGVPAELPAYLQPLTLNPSKHVGWGLSETEAREIEAGSDVLILERIGSATFEMRLGRPHAAAILLQQAQAMSAQIGHAKNAAIQTMTLESLK